MQASLPHTDCALLPQRDLQPKLHFYLNFKLYLFKAFNNALFICTALFCHSDAFKCLVFLPHLCLRLTKLAQEQKPTVTIIRSTDETRYINALRTPSAFKIYTGPHGVYRGTLRGTCSCSLKFLQRLVINAASTEGHGSVNQY